MGNAVDWAVPANSVQNKVAVGGTLAIAADALVFMPSSVEQMFDTLLGTPAEPLLSLLGRSGHAEARQMPFADIAKVGKLDRDLSLDALKAGGLRERLVITMKSGKEEVFVVDDLDDVIRVLSAKLPG